MNWSYVLGLLVAWAACMTSHSFERPLVVIVPSYNNAAYYERNLDSLIAQKYDNYHVFYVDDDSDDDTYALVRKYVDRKGYGHKITVIKNTQRQGALKNIYDVVHATADNVIMITLDGDDWFAHDHALARINAEYARGDVWMTYGQFVFHPVPELGFCASYPQSVISRNAYRQVKFVASHPRTFYAWLFKKIKYKDFLYQGAFFDVTWDQVIMYPMLEMSGERARCISEVLYVYNQINPISDGRIRLQRVLECERYIKNMKPYKRLKNRAG